MAIRDIAKPIGLLAGVTLAAGTLALGYLVARDRDSLRRLVRVAAGTVERVSLALAETREELEDLWAQARDDARQEIEDAEFGEAPSAEQDVGEAAQEPGPKAAQASASPPQPSPAEKPRARRRAV